MATNAFYSEEDLQEILMCAFCENQFDEPKNLPCGNIICTSCESEYFKSAKRKNCELCQDYHVTPANGFPVNHSLRNLLNKKPTKVYRGGLHEEATKVINQIGELNRMYGLDESAYVKSMLIEHCDLLRNNIDLKTESAIDAIQKHREVFLNEINEYQEQCLLNCENIKEFKAFIDQSKENYVNWLNFINRANITDTDVEGVLKESSQLLKAFKSNQKKLEASIFGFQKLQFLENEKEIDSAIIGVLKSTSSSLANLVSNKTTFEINFKDETDDAFQIHQDPILVDNDGERVCIAYSLMNEDDCGYLKLKLFSKDGSLVKGISLEIWENEFYTFGATKFKDSYIIQLTLPDNSNEVQVYNHDLELIRTVPVDFCNSKIYTDNNKVYFYSTKSTVGFWYVYDKNLNRLESIKAGNKESFPFIAYRGSIIELKYDRLFVYDERDLTIVDNKSRTIIETLILDEKYTKDYNMIMHPVSTDSFIMIDRKNSYGELFDLDLNSLKEFTIKNIDEHSSISFTCDDCIGIFNDDKLYLF